MSFMLTGYSEYGCQEFILPEIDNANYSISLDHKLFCIPEDIVLHLDVVDDIWRFQRLSDNAAITGGNVCLEQGLKAGDSIVLSVGTAHIAIVVMEYLPDLCGLQKYCLSLPCQLSIGCDQENDIVCTGNPYISRNHAVLSIGKEHSTISDKSTNGTFINGHRVHGTQGIEYGTCISLFGIQIVWLGNVVAVGSKNGSVRCNLKKLPCATLKADFSNVKAEASVKQYFKRSPRNLLELYKEKIEIEAPPQPQRSAKRPMILTIGPSLTMAVPMIVGTLVAILGSRSSGASASAYMYTGIIIAVLSAIIGSIWTVINVRYAKRQENENEIFRVKKYEEYIARIENEISKRYIGNEQSLNYLYPDAEKCSEYNDGSRELWSRNVSHKDFLYFRLGVGAIPFQCPIVIPQQKFSLIEDDLAKRPQELKTKYEWLKKVPVGIDFKEKHLIGVVGQSKERRAMILRDIVIQAAANICYTDLKMVFLFDGDTPSEQALWAFAKWLPHTWSVDRKIRYFASNETERGEVCFSLANVLRARTEQGLGANKVWHKPYYIVFVADPELLEGEPVSKYLFAPEEDLGVTTVFFAERFEQLPNNCVDIIENNDSFAGILNTERGDSARQQILFDNIEAKQADEFARNISPVEVRETEVGGEIPDSLTFLEMYHAKTLKELRVSERWLKNRTYENMRVPIGQKAGGLAWNLDIHEKYHGPHGLVAGTTGSGKSETLQTYILSLAVNFSPNDVAFFLIDFKGGGMANLFENLPHTAGCISNLSGNQIHRAMVSIKSENRRRQRIFGEFGVNHINQYTKLLKNGEATIPVPHLFIVIDEFAELKREEPDFMRELISVAQVGRSLGVHLILATQKPSGTVDENIWSNTRFRLCLRVQDRQDSNDVLHKPDAAYLTQAGRCYMQVGNDEIYEEFQSGWSGAVYNEDSVADHLELASIWSNTGKSTAVGMGQKKRYLEQKRMQWLMMLLDSAKNVAAEMDVPLTEAVSNSAFLPMLYKRMITNGYDYPADSANSASEVRLLDFIKTCALLEASGVETTNTVKCAKAEFQKYGKVLPEIKEKTQLTAIVDYLAKTAKSSLGSEKFYLWLPVLPAEMHLFDICKGQMFDGEQWPNKVTNTTLNVPVGIIDDPANQTQEPLVIDLARDGNLAVCGSVVSGKSTFLQTFLYAVVNKYSPEQVNIYALDYSNRLLAPFEEVHHCGGVVYDNEPDKTEKLFVLLSNILAERKRQFQGGNYAQYVKANGIAVPYVIVVIDNYASFQEKTENKYESNLLTLTREGANYGIYLVVTAGGFGASEIQNRIADNFRNVLCLEMGDKFKYSEVLRTHHIDILPEAGVKGRGLVSADGRVLEFQTALALRATDDYDRAEKLKICFNEMNQVWHGKTAHIIPTIPEEPAWSDFAKHENVSEVDFQSLGQLPFGWNAKDASVAAIDLSKTYCWLISGKPRTGKTNLLKVLASAAALSESERIIVDFDNNTLRKFSEENQAKYVSNSTELFEMLKNLVPKFKERNNKKRELMVAGYDEEEIFKEMCKFVPIYLFIDDLSDFMRVAYNPPEGVGAVSGFLENITEKGYLHNIFIISALDQTKSAQSIGYKAYNHMITYKTGIHLGGNVAAQRLFDFSGISYQEQTKTTKPGIGLLPSNDYGEMVQKVVIPKMKG